RTGGIEAGAGNRVRLAGNGDPVVQNHAGAIQHHRGAGRGAEGEVVRQFQCADVYIGDSTVAVRAAEQLDAGADLGQGENAGDPRVRHRPAGVVRLDGEAVQQDSVIAEVRGSRTRVERAAADRQRVGARGGRGAQ